MKATQENEWQAAGLFLINGKVVTMVVDTPLLVFDIDGWTTTSIRIFEDLAAKCRVEKDREGEMEFLTMVRELRAWLSKGEVSRTVFPLALRQGIAPRKLTDENLKGYLRKMMSFGRLATHNDELSFFLDLDASKPILYTLGNLKAQANHTGDIIEGKVVNRYQLERKIAEAMLKKDGVVVRIPLSKDRELAHSN